MEFCGVKGIPIVAFQICEMLNQNKRKGGEYVMKLVETFLPEQTCYLSSNPHIILFPLRQIFDHISVHMQMIEENKCKCIFAKFQHIV